MLSSSWISELRSALSRTRCRKCTKTGRRGRGVRAGYAQSFRCVGAAPQTTEALENRCLLSVVGVEGSSVDIAKEFADLGLSGSHTATINWGDGNTTPGTLVGTPGGSGTVTGSHVYADNGEYTITISVTDGDVESDSDTSIATISNVAPTVSNVTVTSLINGNDFATLSGDISDPGIGDTFTLTVDWGAGAPVSYSIAAGATSFSVSHNYLSDVPVLTSGDTFTVTGTLTDDDGGSAPLANSAGGLITFDDLTTPNTFFGHGISTSYHGFAWGYSRFSGLENAVIPSTSIFWDWASATVSNPGVSPGPTPVSGDSYAWNSDGPQSLFIDFRAPTTVASAYFATLSSGYSFNATTVQLFAYDESGSLQSESSVLNLTNSFQQLNAGFTGVRFLEIRGNATGRNFSIDDLELGAPLAVTIDKVPPTLSGLSATSILENGTTTLSGHIANVAALDTVTVEIDWDDDGTIDETHSNVAAGNFSYNHQFLDDDPTGTPVDNLPISVRVTNAAGSVTGRTAVEVANVAPTLSDLSATPIVEGGTTIFSGTIADVGTLDTIRVDIDWDDDGTIDETHLNVGAGNFSYSHQYLDDNATGAPVGKMPIRVTVTDDDTGTVRGSTLVEVTNVAPTLSDLSATPIVENGTTTFSGTIADVGVLDTFRVEIDWDNDGTIDESHLNVGAGDFSYNHQYLDDNPTGSPVDNMLINVTVTDDDSGTVDGYTTVEVTNVAPTLSDLAAMPIVEGGTTTFSGTIADVGVLDTFTVEIDWDNDGTIDETHLNVAGGNFSYNHHYLDDNPTRSPVDNMPINVTVTDDDSGTVDGYTTVEVTNVAPTLSDLLATPIVEGGSTTFSGTIADVGTQDTFTIEIDWDDDGVTDETHLNVGAGRFSYTHQYLDDNANGATVDNLPIYVTVTDDDTGSVDGSALVEVSNVAPTLSNLAATPIVENGTTTFSGTIADAGVLDTFTVEIDWDNDGTIDETHLNVGSGNFSYTHQYLDDNPTRSPVDNVPINVTVTDDDTGTVDGSTSVEVSNLDPVLAPITTNDTRGNKAVVGQQISVSGLFTDVGTLDTHTVIVQWDDGSVSSSELDPGDFSALEVDGGGAGSFTGIHTYTTGGIFKVVVTVIDDDTGESNSSVVEVWVSGVRLTGDGELQIIGTTGKDVINVSLVKGTDGGPEQVKVVANLDVPAASEGGNKKKRGKGNGGGSNVGADIYHFSPDDIQTVRIVLCAGDDHATLNGGSEASGQPWYVSSLMEGDGGKDQLTGGAGADVILGGTGNDKLSGQDGNDVLLGGDGRDDLRGGRGHDVLAGAAGNDKLSGNAGDDILIGGDGKDDLKAGKGDDLLIADFWANEGTVAALDALHDAWMGPESYEEKSSALTAAGGLLDASTLTADAFKDTLKGDKGRDLFFASPIDKVKDRKNDEDLFAI
jgi:hypothetical protein